MSGELCLSCCGRGQSLVGMNPVEFAECDVCGGSGELSETPEEQLEP
jgi:hypothetical protein